MFRTIEVKVGLGNRGKWTSEHDVSQDVYNYIYIYIYIYIFAKVKFQKLVPLSMLYTYLILLFLVCYF